MGNGADTKIEKTIGVIIEPYEEHEPSGLSYVTAEYLRGMVQCAPQFAYIVYTKQPFTLFPLPENARNVIIPKSLLGKNWYFMKKYFFHKDRFPDVLVFNMPLLPLILPKKVKTAVYCHEVLYEPDTSGFFQHLVRDVWRLMAHYTMKHARVIFSATRAVAREAAQTYGVPMESIRIVPHGIRPIPEHIAPQTRFTMPYFLFVGRTKYKKNMHGIIEGFLRFKERTHAPTLLCLAGRTKDKPYLTNLLDDAVRRGFVGSIIRTGYVPEEELATLFKGAAAFVFCSLAEGFGLPIPEAMSMGVPVITSDIPVLSEVSGGAALLVDPRDPDAIAGAMESITTDIELRTQLIEKGLAQAKKFQWSTASSDFTKEIVALLSS
jgi:glycosyltransferase involved in cell wall biosynthesis